MQDFDKMSDEQQMDYWIGHICMAIGKGDIRGALYRMMLYYRQEAYNRGIEEGKRQQKKGKQ